MALLFAPVLVRAQMGADALTAAIAATLRFTLERSGLSADDSKGAATLLAVSSALNDIVMANGGTAGVATSWGRILKWLFAGREGGSFGGGGASGGWGDYCSFIFRLDADGRVIVPAPPLAVGGPIKPRTTSGWHMYMADIDGKSYVQDDQDKVMNIFIHYDNIARGGGEPLRWLGWYSVQVTSQITGLKTYKFSRPATIMSSGTKILYELRIRGPGVAYYNTEWYGNPGYNRTFPCPMDENAGGDFHFYGYTSGYANTGFDQCLMYAPNYGMSKTGYAYGDYAAIPPEDLPSWPKYAPPSLRKCKIAPSLIALATEKLWSQAAAKPGYSGHPAQPVPVADVRTNGEDPTVQDLAEDPRKGIPQEPFPGHPPSSDPPKPPPQSGGIDLGQPGPDTPKTDSDLAAPDFGWWPTMPAISIATSNTCPTWQFTAFERDYVLDSHCIFAEQNRALISALMLVVFAIASARIVLGA